MLSTALIDSDNISQQGSLLGYFLASFSVHTIFKVMDLGEFIYSQHNAKFLIPKGAN